MLISIVVYCLLFFFIIGFFILVLKLARKDWVPTEWVLELKGVVCVILMCHLHRGIIVVCCYFLI